MSVYTNWSLTQTREIIRRELMDPTGRWWSNEFLNLNIDQWQNELQQDYELVWGSCTFTTAINVIQISDINPPMSRLEAIYFIGSSTGDRGYRLSGRLLQDLEVGNPGWRDALLDTPREVVQYDSTQMLIWPPMAQTSKIIFEYPRALSFNGDSSTISLPPWTQWSVKPFVCSKAYLQPGPVNDINKALKYQKLYEVEKSRIKLLWDNWLPDRYRRLKPASHYEWDILKPPPAWSAPGPQGSILDIYRSFVPTGNLDGSNTIFTIPIFPDVVKLFRNGLLQLIGSGNDYTFSGNTITFTVPPDSGDDLVIWTFTQGS